MGQEELGRGLVEGWVIPVMEVIEARVRAPTREEAWIGLCKGACGAPEGDAGQGS